MSLVAYDASSDEGSDYEDDESTKAIIVENTSAKPTQSLPYKAKASIGHISDEDDYDFISQSVEKENNFTNLSKLLPKPKQESNTTENLDKFSSPTFAALPTPKSVDAQVEIEEEDDEFLHKVPSKEIIENVNKPVEVKKLPVKITIPSLNNFQDVDKELADKAKHRNNFSNSKVANSSGLLSMLPKAKSERNFTKETILTTTDKISEISAINPAVPSFIPDSVKHRRPATNTEDVERINPSRKNAKKQIMISKQSDVKVDNDESDDENTTDNDFFSFNTDQNLPEVSTKEINSLVAKKTVQIFEASSKFMKTSDSQTPLGEEDMQSDEQELELSRKRLHEQQTLNSEALQALVGGSTKRRRQQSNIQVIELNSSQVMPNKDEWMRTALASSTSYQPTGVLVDEEPASGTRRKHQITYLAHKAKANEAELQAMWSANRQNRRATQSKYGF